MQTIGKANGFNKDPEVHISLPDTLKQVKTALQAVGMGQYADDIELKLN